MSSSDDSSTNLIIAVCILVPLLVAFSTVTLLAHFYTQPEPLEAIEEGQERTLLRQRIIQPRPPTQSTPLSYAEVHQIREAYNYSEPSRRYIPVPARNSAIVPVERPKGPRDLPRSSRRGNVSAGAYTPLHQDLPYTTVKQHRPSAPLEYNYAGPSQTLYLEVPLDNHQVRPQSHLPSPPYPLD